MERIILHVDVNNAFLSWTAVYLLKSGYKKDIREGYAIIAGDESKRRGIVLAKSNPCKRKGVVTAEPIYSARRKCPYLEIYPPNFEIYRKFSNMMYNYLSQYTDKIERYSIDECFLDYTDSYNLFGDPIKVAYKIKNDIYKNLGFTVNVGVSNNKLLAKMASDFEKPNKVHTLFTNEVKDKMWPLPVNNLFMIGKSYSKKLIDMNIKTIGELASTDRIFLEKKFKSMGIMMHNYANGIDDSPVYFEKEEVKSISSSTVLAYNYKDDAMIKEVIVSLSNQVGKKLRDNKMYANVVGIWFKYNYFDRYSKQITLENSISTDEEIYNMAYKIFKDMWNKEDGIRSICVFLGGLSNTKIRQLSLFDTNNEEIKHDEKLQGIIDDIRNKYGNDIISYANMKERK